MLSKCKNDQTKWPSAILSTIKITETWKVLPLIRDLLLIHHFQVRNTKSDVLQIKI